MKRIISFGLVLMLILSLGITVLGAGSPTSGSTSGSTTSAQPQATARGMDLFDSNDNRIATVPAGSIRKISVANANRLGEEDRAAFLAAYEEARSIEGRVVKYFYWLDIPEKYKTDDFSYANYIFTCTGSNGSVQVNGKDMEVEMIGRNKYCARLTEFGSLAILCD